MEVVVQITLLNCSFKFQISCLEVLIFWFLILFLAGLFILFLPVEFIGTYRLYNSTFKDLILNIIYCIFISLFFLFTFQYLLEPQNLIMNDVSSIGKATSFSGFIAVPIFLFLPNLFKSILTRICPS